MPISLVLKAIPESDPILQAASRMEGRLKRAFLRAVEAMKGRIEWGRLEEAIKAGDVNGALAILALDRNFTSALQGQGVEPGVESFRDAVQATFQAGALAGMNRLPKSISVETSFNMLSREAVDFLSSYEFTLIRDLSTQSEEAIRQILLRGFQVGGHPTEMAREIREVIGLTARQEAAVANYQTALSSGATLRDALSRSLRDGRYDRTLLRALNNGTGLSQPQIDKMTTRYRERYLNYRAQTIARTETIRAAAKGQRESWRQAESQGLLRNAKRVWIVSGDDRTCPVCDSLDGEVAGLDEEFAPGIMDPPDPHSDCRCATALQFG